MKFIINVSLIKLIKSMFDKILMFLRVWFINKININFISYVIEIEKVWICKISVKNIGSWIYENNEIYLTEYNAATVFTNCFWILITNIRHIKLIFEIQLKKQHCSHWTPLFIIYCGFTTAFMAYSIGKKN